MQSMWTGKKSSCQNPRICLSPDSLEQSNLSFSTSENGEVELFTVDAYVLSTENARAGWRTKNFEYRMHNLPLKMEN